MAALELITPAEYARRRGVTRAAVSIAVKAGRISTIGGKIDPAVADIQWEANTRKAVGRGRSPNPQAHDGAASGADAASDRRPGAPGDPERAPFDYEASRAKREHHEAILAEAKAMERLGQLAEVSKVRAAMADIGRVVSDHLERLPDRVSAQITPGMSPADIHARIDAELTNLRADLASAVSALPAKLGLPAPSA